MSQHHLPCFVIADGGQARFIQPGADEALHVWAALESPTLHQKAHDMGSDGPGRAFESATPTRHAMAPRSDPHERAEVAFADLVTERIRAEAAEGTHRSPSASKRPEKKPSPSTARASATCNRCSP